MNRFNHGLKGESKYITYPDMLEFTREEYFFAIIDLISRSAVCLVNIDKHVLIKLGVYLQCEDMALYVISKLNEIEQIPSLLVLFC